jgi:hypothetical protein
MGILPGAIGWKEGGGGVEGVEEDVLGPGCGVVPDTPAVGGGAGGKLVQNGGS